MCALAALLLAAPAGAVVLKSASGQKFGILLHKGVSANQVAGMKIATAGQASAGGIGGGGTLAYSGGPVLHSSAPYLLFWDPGSAMRAADKALLAKYLTDSAADSSGSSNVFGVLRQYTDTSGFADYKQTFTGAQAIVDSNPYPTAGGCTATSPPAYSTCLTDAQLQAELTAFLQAHPSLPTGTGANAPIYFIVTPQTVNICDDASGASCATNTFCAYHSAIGQGSNAILYGSIPFLVWAQNQPKGCQFDGNSAVQEPNGQQADIQISSMSHELSETITDPLPGSGWVNTSSGNEVGDNCAFYGATADPAHGYSPTAWKPVLGGSASGTLFDQSINGHPYYTQTEWSNGSGGCDAKPPAATLWPAFTTTHPGSPATALTFKPSGTASGGYSSATWSFGDGSSSFNSGAPTQTTHTYAGPGQYTASLTVVDKFGNLSTVSQTVAAGALPAVSFSPPGPPVLPNSSISFSGSATDANQGGTITSYSWNFGDGTPAVTGTSPSHTFAAAGQYQVSLTATDNYGLTGTVTHTISVGVAPTASFTAPTGLIVTGGPVTFDASGSTTPNPGATIKTYTWNFGDGPGSVSSSTPATQHTYAAAGTYTVTLTVTDSDGLPSAPVTEQVVVDQPPTAAFTGPATVAPGVQASFSAASSSDPNQGTSITSYTWSFGDGSSGSGAVAQHAYAAPGSYQVRLTVSDSLGLTGTSTQTITVGSAPTAVFSAPGALLVGGTAMFDGSGSTDPNSGASISSYTWNFGDGSPQISGASPTAQHSFDPAGTYTVTLTVTDSLGLTSRSTQVITVGSAPTAAFTAPAATLSTSSSQSFDASSSADPNPGATIASYSWNFGDGSTPVTSSTPSTQHSYGTAGTYTVTLTVTNSLGFTASASHQVAVANPPHAAFDATPANAAAGVPVTFNAGSSSDPNPGGAITSYHWNFGDGSAIATGAAPTHTYTAAGRYTVTLVTADALGLSNTITEQLVVVPAQITGVSARGNTVTVSVNAPGTVVIGKAVAKVTANAAQIKPALTRRQRQALQKHHKLRLQLAITFVPAAGPAQQQHVTVTLAS